MNYLLITSRWMCDDFVFVGYNKDVGILIDVGPFPEDPNDAQVDEGYRYLLDHCPPFLTLGDAEWTLDIAKLTEEIPELKSQSLAVELTHPPAFETTSIIDRKPDPLLSKPKMIPLPSASLSETSRLFNPSLPGECYFLRIGFGPQTTADPFESDVSSEDGSEDQNTDETTPP